MGRPPSNGAPAFRFNPNEVAEMESILKAHNTTVPTREVLDALAEKFSASPERSGKITVHSKQVWNWFQNRRYAIRAKEAKSPVKFEAAKSPLKVGGPIALQDDSATMRNVPQARQSLPTASAVVRSVPQAQQAVAAPSVIPAQSTGRNTSDSPQLEFEAKSARDGAWYDVAFFLSHRHLDTGDPEVLVRFSGFGSEEDEWVNVCRHVRQRSLPCESSECIVVLPGDLILCFQEGKEQALYFDAHVLDAQRRRHDVRGCRCRFLVRYDHDQSEEIVPLRKVCRRPETDYRLQQLHVANDSATQNQQKTSMDPHQTGGTLRVYPPVETLQKHNKANEQHDLAAAISHVEYANIPATTISSAAYARVPAATINPGAHVNVPAATISSVAHANSFAATISPAIHVNVAATISPAIHVNVAATTTNPADHANVPAATIFPAVSANVSTANTFPAVNANVPVATIFPAVNVNVPAATITLAARPSVPVTTITSAARASIPASTIAPTNVCVPAASITLAADVNAKVPAATVTPTASANVPTGPLTSAAHASIPATTITPTAHASVPAAFITPAAHANFPVAPITLDLHANVPAANENKVPQPEVPETVTTGNMGNSNVPGSNIVMMTDTNTNTIDASGQTISHG